MKLMYRFVTYPSNVLYLSQQPVTAPAASLLAVMVTVFQIRKGVMEQTIVEMDLMKVAVVSFMINLLSKD